MSWFEEQLQKVIARKTDLEELDELIIDALEKGQNKTPQYALLVQERDHLKQYIQCIQQRMKLYCDSCTQCDECVEATVHLVLG